MKILLVDDMPDLVPVFKHYFEKMGHSLCYATDGYWGLICLEREDFDLIITDLNMPGIDGYEFSHKARMISQAPILLHTAQIYPEKRGPIQEVIAKGDLDSIKKYLHDVPMDRQGDL